MMEGKELREKRRVRRYVAVFAPVCLFLAVIVLLGGCGSESIGTEDVSMVQETPLPVTEQPEVSVAPKQTPEVEKEDDEEEEFNPMEITKGDLESNFAEAMKYVTICGKKVSFPFSLDDLGKEFTFQALKHVTQKGKDNQGCLYYKGEIIASIVIQGGREKGDIRKKKICWLHFSKWEEPNVDFNICGVSFDTPTENVFDICGEGDGNGNGIYWENGKSGKHANCVVVLGDPDGKVYDVSVTYGRKGK